MSVNFKRKARAIGTATALVVAGCVVSSDGDAPFASGRVRAFRGGGTFDLSFHRGHWVGEPEP